MSGKTRTTIKKRVIIAAMLAAVMLSVVAPPVGASQIVCFTGVNDTLLPLREATLPAYFGTTLYVPSGVFALAEVTVSLSSSRGNLYVKRGNRSLNFFIELGAVTDQDGLIYEDVPVERIGVLYFLPLEFVCEYFKLSYSIIPSDPASILRIKTSDAVYNDKTFAGHFKSQMEIYYNEYLTAKAAAAMRPTPTPGSGGTPVTTQPSVYEGSTVFLSFFGVSAEYTPRILDALKLASARACFFVSADELKAAPSLARRIYGEGHSMGAFLTSDDAEEYDRVAALLFEAAKVKSPLVASPPAVAAEVREMCSERGLIYRPASVYADTAASSDPGALFPTERNVVFDIRFKCTEDTHKTLTAALSALTDAGFSLDAITETSANAA
ncbi:MAG: polysaccharide deacetylase family protein [Oscillospiraceae bacterium]|nr:polysaccharide deacetylase family protein [Oscillospiraceae bacterium]